MFALGGDHICRRVLVAALAPVQRLRNVVNLKFYIFFVEVCLCYFNTQRNAVVVEIHILGSLDFLARRDFSDRSDIIANQPCCCCRLIGVSGAVLRTRRNRSVELVCVNERRLGNVEACGEGCTVLCDFRSLKRGLVYFFVHTARVRCDDSVIIEMLDTRGLVVAGNINLDLRVVEPVFGSSDC